MGVGGLLHGCVYVRVCVFVSVCAWGEEVAVRNLSPRVKFNEMYLTLPRTYSSQ